VDVRVQAKDVRIHKIEKISFRLILQIHSYERIIYRNDNPVNDSEDEINIPVLERGSSILIVFTGSRRD
jgi:hypothetical protein